MEFAKDYLKNSYLNAKDAFHLDEIVSAVFIFLVSEFILTVLKHYTVAILKRLPRTTLGSIFQIIIEEIPHKFIVFISLYLALVSLGIRGVDYRLGKFLDIFFLFILIFYLIKLLNNIIERYSYDVIKRTSDKSVASMYSYITTISQALIWILFLIVFLSNIGVDVSALITGLGIGGVALALAARDIISDIISSFLIIINKSVSVGDHIKLGDEYGVVQKIRIKNTLVKTSKGYDLIVPNSEFTSKIFKNYYSGLRDKVRLTLILGNNGKFDHESISGKIKKAFSGLEDKKLRNVYVRLIEVKTDLIKLEISFNYRFETLDEKDVKLAKFLSLVENEIRKLKYDINTLADETII
jgi:small-conductance mechanosensitive channel